MESGGGLEMHNHFPPESPLISYSTADNFSQSLRLYIANPIVYTLI